MNRNETELLWPEEAEKIEIGKLLANDHEYYLRVHEQIKPEDFYNSFFRKVYTVLIEQFEKTGKVDFVRIADEVGEHQVKLAEIIQAAGLYQHVSWPITKIQSFSRRRKLRDGITSVLRKIGGAEDEQHLFNELANIAVGGRREGGKVVTGMELADQIYERQGLRKADFKILAGYSTGFDRLDYHLGGLCNRRITLLSGPSGHGKTGMVVNWLNNICIEQKVPGLFVSLEMGLEDVQDRFLSILMDTPLDRIKRGANANLGAFMDVLKGSPLFISDNYPRDIHDVAAMIEKYTILHGIKIWVLDYIGEVVRDNMIKGREDRDERYARWVKILRDVSKRLDIHGIILCQVNAEGNLAESKKMAHIADAWLHFEREESAHILECRKNRFGPAGYKYNIEYNRTTQKMREIGLLET